MTLLQPDVVVDVTVTVVVQKRPRERQKFLFATLVVVSALVFAHYLTLIGEMGRARARVALSFVMSGKCAFVFYESN